MVESNRAAFDKIIKLRNYYRRKYQHTQVYTDLNYLEIF